MGDLSPSRAPWIWHRQHVRTNSPVPCYHAMSFVPVRQYYYVRNMYALLANATSPSRQIPWSWTWTASAGSVPAEWHDFLIRGAPRRREFLQWPRTARANTAPAPAPAQREQNMEHSSGFCWQAAAGPPIYRSIHSTQYTVHSAQDTGPARPLHFTSHGPLASHTARVTAEISAAWPVPMPPVHERCEHTDR